MEQSFLSLRETYLQRLRAFLKIAHSTNGLRLFAGFTEAAMNHFVIAFPPAPVFGVLEPWKIFQKNQEKQVLVRIFGLNVSFMAYAMV